MTTKTINESPEDLEGVMLTHVGEDYEVFKSCMEKYTRDKWY